MSIFTKIKSFIFPTRSVCSVCLKSFKDKDLRAHDTLALCPYDYNDFQILNHVLYKSIETSVDHPERGVEIYQLQKELISQGVKSYILSSYKEMEGEIVTEMKLFCLHKKGHH